MHDTIAFYPMYVASAQVPVAQTGTLQLSTTLAATDAAQSTARFAGVDKNAYLQIRVANASTAWAWVNFGVFGSLVAAAVGTGYPIAPGSVEVITVDEEVTAASVILGTAAATGNVTFTRGAGI